MLLTEVLKERDAQIEMKNGQLDAEKIREAHLLRLQQRVSDGTYSIYESVPAEKHKYCISFASLKLPDESTMFGKDDARECVELLTCCVHIFP